MLLIYCYIFALIALNLIILCYNLRKYNNFAYIYASITRYIFLF